MSMNLSKALLISILFISQWSFSQSESDPENKSTVYTKDGSVFTGKVVYEDFLTTDIVILTGDTISLSNSDISEKYEYKDVFHYPKGRFHYKDGFHIDINQGIGLSGNGGLTLLDISINKRITSKLTLGAGFGSQRIFSSLVIPAGASNLNLNIANSNTPLFVQGKYYLNRNRRSMYVHGRLGYTIGKNELFNLSETNNGFLCAYGIGFTKATKGRLKTFFQVTQSHNFSSGTAFNQDINGPLNFDYELWFNRLGVSWGLEYNLSGKFKRTKNN